MSLVAGGAGFLGSHLSEFLIGRGDDVICVDDLSTGSIANIEPIKNSGRFTFIIGDISELDFGENHPLFSELKKVKKIFNFACPASPPHYQRDPIKTLLTSTMGTKNLLDFSSRQKGRFLQASTSEVYGQPLVTPQMEGYFGNVNPVGPRSCYDEGKRVGETFCYEYGKLGKSDTVIIRIFNTYGPRMGKDDGRVIPNFICQALLDEPITLYGDGLQTRSFLYVDDLMDGVVKAFEKEGFKGPVNLGNPSEITIRELAVKIIALTGSQSIIKELPALEDDPRQRCPDIALAREELGWNPTISLNEGLKKTIAYFKQVID